MPAEIYWRRRLLVLAVVIALIWVGTQVFGGGGDPEAKPEATVTPTVTATPEPAPTEGPLSVTLVSSTKSCDPEKILTPASADLLVVISANKIAVWDSTVCKTSLLATPVAISPGWATLADATWSGRGSGSKCSPKEGFATPGKYTIQAGTLGGEPGKTTFTLNPAPKPTVTPTKTPTPKTSTKPPDE